ncbi:MAG: hypothetical protein CM15mV125_010 [uncultured marine virus]|nr:MAG: hypothetical protein CM15mV125_010 [uncultured marine virus]
MGLIKKIFIRPFGMDKRGKQTTSPKVAPPKEHRAWFSPKGGKPFYRVVTGTGYVVFSKKKRHQGDDWDLIFLCSIQIFPPLLPSFGGGSPFNLTPSGNKPKNKGCSFGVQKYIRQNT